MSGGPGIGPMSRGMEQNTQEGVFFNDIRGFIND